jgi:hypothetical protein
VTCLEVAEGLREIAVDASFYVVLYYAREALGHQVPHDRCSVEECNRHQHRNLEFC